MTQRLKMTSQPRCRQAPRRITASIGMALFFVITQAACQPGDDVAPRTSTGSSASFTIDSVEVGVGFDEAVQVDGARQSSVSTSVSLSFDPADDAFAGVVSAEDAAGNTARVRVEVRREE